MLSVAQFDVDKINQEVEKSLKENETIIRPIKNETIDEGFIENNPRINLREIDFEDFLKECPPNQTRMDQIYHLFDEH